MASTSKQGSSSSSTNNASTSTSSSTATSSQQKQLPADSGSEEDSDSEGDDDEDDDDDDEEEEKFSDSASVRSLRRFGGRSGGRQRSSGAAASGTATTADYGKVVCVDYADKRGTKTKEVWFPAMIIDPADVPSSSAASAITPKDLKLAKDLVTVRSFRDGRFYNVSRRDARDFRLDNVRAYMEGGGTPELRVALEKAGAFLERAELPEGWTMPSGGGGGGGEDTDNSNMDNEDNNSSSSQMTSGSQRSNSRGKSGGAQQQRRAGNRNAAPRTGSSSIASTSSFANATPSISLAGIITVPVAEGNDNAASTLAMFENVVRQGAEAMAASAAAAASSATDDDQHLDLEELLKELEVKEREEDSEEVREEKARRRAKMDADRDGFVGRLLMFHDATRSGDNVSLESFPRINGVEVDIYHLYLIVNKLGGPNRMKSRRKWLGAFQCLGLPPPPEPPTTATTTESTTTPKPTQASTSKGGLGGGSSNTTPAYETYLRFARGSAGAAAAAAEAADDDSQGGGGGSGSGNSSSLEEDILAPEGSPLWLLRDVYHKYLMHFRDIDRKVGGVQTTGGHSRRNTYRMPAVTMPMTNTASSSSTSARTQESVAQLLPSITGTPHSVSASASISASLLGGPSTSSSSTSSSTSTPAQEGTAPGGEASTSKPTPSTPASTPSSRKAPIAGKGDTAPFITYWGKETAVGREPSPKRKRPPAKNSDLVPPNSGGGSKCFGCG